MPSAGFEPAIPATKRPQTYALDRAATGIGGKTRNAFHILVGNVVTRDHTGCLHKWEDNIKITFRDKL
jgi:hypothetical protein